MFSTGILNLMPKGCASQTQNKDSFLGELEKQVYVVILTTIPLDSAHAACGVCSTPNCSLYTLLGQQDIKVNIQVISC